MNRQAACMPDRDSPCLKTRTRKKRFCYTDKVICQNRDNKNILLQQKMFVLSTKRLFAAAKFLVEATKNSLVVPNFVAVTKPFFSVINKFPIEINN